MAIDGRDVSELDRVARARHRLAMGEIETSWTNFKRGTPLKSENAVTRSAAADRRKRSMAVGAASMAGAEALQGPRNNFLPVSFLSLGAAVSRAIAQIRVPRGNRIGTGFLCAPGLFITNHHVLSTPDEARDATVTFDFVDDASIRPCTFRLDPDACFFFDVTTARDFAIVAVGEPVASETGIESFGFCPLSNAKDKHSLGEFANIIQHPLGEPKQVVLQDNLIVGRGDLVLHYYADTQQASSGSCVLNNDWQAIALHHWGQAVHDLPQANFYDPVSVNQGVRISQIVEFVEDGLGALSGTARERLTRMLELGVTASPGEAARHAMVPMPVCPVDPVEPAKPQESAPARAQAIATWTIPLELSISIPGLAPHSVPSRGPAVVVATPAPAALQAESGLPRTGEGYRADFLDNHLIALPRMSEALEGDVTPLLEPDQFPSARPGELQYRHFSILMSKSRKLCRFAASNVNGASLFGINSEGVLRDYADRDERDFRARPEAGAEGGASWFFDDRIDAADQTGDRWYTGQNRLLPRDGTDDAAKYREWADFDRGHTVRRTEPIWGSERAGREADFQSHCVTNVLPQQPLFNKSRRRLDGEIDPGEETRSWFGMEVAVLRAAHDGKAKMNVFSGPVFREDDPFYDEGRPGKGGARQVPLSFWKIAVWEDAGKLKSLAMIARQDWALAPLAPGAAEALDDPGQMVLLRDFLTSVKDIADATGIVFDKQVLAADILKGRTKARIGRMTFADFRALANGSACED
jgi:endonuclease G